MKTGLLPMKVEPPATMAGSTLMERMAVLCMRTATVVASCYFVFVSYVAVAYTHNWAEKLRLLPLILLALTVPLLGKVIIRKKRNTYSVNEDNIQCMDSGGGTLRQKQVMARPTKKHPFPELSQPMDFDYWKLRTATGNFSQTNKLWEGVFGTAYKGILREAEVIVLTVLPDICPKGTRELKKELALLAKLRHRNLVRLFGVSLEQPEKLLVYEYMPNGSLDTHLLDDVKRRLLDLGKRLKIVNGVAQGLQYLHEDCQPGIILGNLKPCNVLLDSDFNAKISDFRLAKLFEREQSQAVSRHVAGTRGYMSLEYAMRGQSSVKSDVYSFGILILEIVTGRNSSSCTNSKQFVDLLSLAWEHWTTGTIGKLVDPSLGGRFSGRQMQKLINIGLLCVQDNPAERPTMSAVNVMLSSNTVSLSAPKGSQSLVHRGQEAKGDVAAGVASLTLTNQDDEGVESKLALPPPHNLACN